MIFLKGNFADIIVAVMSISNVSLHKNRKPADCDTVACTQKQTLFICVLFVLFQKRTEDKSVSMRPSSLCLLSQNTNVIF